MEQEIKEISELLKSADRVLFITGAGMSADSGLPTYRGIGGLYNDRETADNIPIEEALSGEMLRRKPEITWRYIMEIEKCCRGADYNRGHEIIAEIEKVKPDTWVLTQNVDGFHRDAGSENLIEIHGWIYDLYCQVCPKSMILEDYSRLEVPPICPDCGGGIRPNVVFFGEMLPQNAVQTLMEQLQKGFDLVFSIGTTSVFPYIAQPVMQAAMAGIPTVEINPGQTSVSSYVKYRLSGGASDILEKIWNN